MRVLLDANVIIRMLLRRPNTNRAVDVVLQAGIRQSIRILVSPIVEREVLARVADKPFLAQRIRCDDAVAFLDELKVVGVGLPALFGPPVRICRDPKDDHLLSYAESGMADYLLTGDEDLLVLDGQFPFRIIAPPEFLAVLRERGLA